MSVMKSVYKYAAFLGWLLQEHKEKLLCKELSTVHKMFCHTLETVDSSLRDLVEIQQYLGITPPIQPKDLHLEKRDVYLLMEGVGHSESASFRLAWVQSRFWYLLGQYQIEREKEKSSKVSQSNRVEEGPDLDLEAEQDQKAERDYCATVKMIGEYINSDFVQGQPSLHLNESLQISEVLGDLRKKVETCQLLPKVLFQTWRLLFAEEGPKWGVSIKYLWREAFDDLDASSWQDTGWGTPKAADQTFLGIWEECLHTQRYKKLQQEPACYLYARICSYMANKHPGLISDLFMEDSASLFEDMAWFINRKPFAGSLQERLIKGFTPLNCSFFSEKVMGEDTRDEWEFWVEVLAKEDISWIGKFDDATSAQIYGCAWNQFWGVLGETILAKMTEKLKALQEIA